MLSILSQLLVPDRHRPKSAKVGLAVPMMVELPGVSTAKQALVTNTRGDFVQTRRTADGTLRLGLFDCSLEDEPKVLAKLFRTLQREAKLEGWKTCHPDLVSALSKMREVGTTPKSVILASDLAKAVTSHELKEGETLTLSGLNVITTNGLVDGQAMVAANPTALGVYVRIGDQLGIQLYDVQHNLYLVDPSYVG